MRMEWSAVFILLIFTVSLTSSKSLTREENEQRLQSCGVFHNSKILNGRLADQSEAPWSVRVDGTPSMGCTGTVISPRHVITATHCMAKGITDDGWNIVKEFNQNCQEGHYFIHGNDLKGLEITSNGKVVAKNADMGVLLNACVRKRVPPGKTAVEVYEDIAVIELKEDLKFTETLQMACTPTDTTPVRIGDKLFFYGFGYDPTAGVKHPSPLKTHNITIIADKKNVKEYFFSAQAPKTVACPGDSGGGSMKNYNGKVTIAGVLSHSNCMAAVQHHDTEYHEYHAAVSYYYKFICQYEGICTIEDYDRYHMRYLTSKASFENDEKRLAKSSLNISPVSTFIIALIASLFV